MAQVFVNVEGIAATTAAYFPAALSPEASSGSSGICISGSTDSYSKVAVGFVVPFVFAAGLVVISAASRGVCRHGRRVGRQRFAGSLAQLVLFAFSSFSGATFTLLSCVETPAGSRQLVLFKAGSVQCGTWQVWLFLLAGAIIALAGAPLFVALLCTVPERGCCGPLARWGKRQRLPDTRTARALRDTVLRPFRQGCWLWPSLLALQRLAVAAVGALSTNKIKAAEMTLCIASAALVMQLLYQPHTNRDVNFVQSVASLSLACIAALNVPLQTLHQAGIQTSQPGSSGAYADAHYLNLAMAFFIMLPMVIVLPYFAFAPALSKHSAMRGLQKPRSGTHQQQDMQGRLFAQATQLSDDADEVEMTNVNTATSSSNPAYEEEDPAARVVELERKLQHIKSEQSKYLSARITAEVQKAQAAHAAELEELEEDKQRAHAAHAEELEKLGAEHEQDKQTAQAAHAAELERVGQK
jgi:hypothetical protein